MFRVSSEGRSGHGIGYMLTPQPSPILLAKKGNVAIVEDLS